MAVEGDMRWPSGLGSAGGRDRPTTACMHARGDVMTRYGLVWGSTAAPVHTIRIGLAVGPPSPPWRSHLFLSRASDS